MNDSTRCFKSWCRTLAGVALVLASLAASAHQGSEGYVQMQQTPAGLHLRVDAALGDLDVPLKIDANGDSRITAGELRAAWPGIDAYVRARVQVPGCAWHGVAESLATHNGKTYAALDYDAACEAHEASAPPIRYTLFRDIDVNHRATARIEWVGAIHTRVLNPQAETADSAQTAFGGGTLAFVKEGIHHIVTGYDHVLFLLSLLFPSVMRRTRNGWEPVDNLRQALWPVLGIVSAFTLAHSITLTLAAMKWVTIPSSIIEPAIAVTIVLAAFDNLHPVLGQRRALVTFAFGLVHGFGFADVLAELRLPTWEFIKALVQFNLGLELGQLAIVALVGALLYTARQARAYVPWVLRGGSLAAITLGVLWFVERTTDLAFLSFLAV
jgi:hypothetical protein